MLFQSRIYRAASPLLLALASTGAAAADPTFSYRGMQLGDRLETASTVIAGKFAYIDREEDSDRVTLVARESAGAGLRGCPTNAWGVRAVDCLVVRFVFMEGEGGRKLTLVTVGQSFSTAIPAEDMLAKLQAAYGVPRGSYERRYIIPSQVAPGEDDIALVWGGKHVPLAPYRPGLNLYADFKMIGGKYVSAQVYRKDRMVSGYDLVIVDAERASAINQSLQRRLQQDEANKQKTSVGALHF